MLVALWSVLRSAAQQWSCAQHCRAIALVRTLALWASMAAIPILLTVSWMRSYAQHTASSALSTPPSTEQLIDSLESVWKVYQQNDWADTAVVHLLHRLSGLYGVDHPVQAREYALAAKRIAERIGDRYGVALAQKQIAFLYRQESKYDQAIEYYFNALRLYEALSDTRNIAEVLTGIGVVYSIKSEVSKTQGNPLGLEYLSKAASLYEQLGDKRTLAKVVVNLGNAYWEVGDSAQALTHYYRAINLQRQLADTNDLATSFVGIGNVYFKQERLDSALAYYQQALALSMQTGQSPVNIYNNLAAVYIQTGNYTKALQYLNKGLALASGAQHRLIRSSIYLSLLDVYSKLGNDKLALEYALAYNALSDSIYSEESDRRIAEANARYNVAVKDLDIERKKNELAMKEAEIQQQRQNQRNLLIGLGLVITIVLLLLYGYNIKQRSETALQHKNLELERANHQISLQNQHLEELNNEKNELMGIVAHDLKNPILSIKLLSQLIHDQATLTAEERQRFTSTIISSSEQMARIINNLLDVNAIERGGIKLTKSVFDLAVAAYTTFEEYEPIAANKGITLHFESNGDAECIADKTATAQILDNLVSNAIKYSPKGKNVWIRVIAHAEWKHTDSHHQQPANASPVKNGDTLSLANTRTTNGTATTTIEHSARYAPTPYCVRVEIQDEGPGLSDEDKKKLFGKFVRLSAQPTAGEGSTGLGLSIVKKMVTAMNGHVWCESVYGQGATFIVELPEYDESSDYAASDVPIALIHS